MSGLPYGELVARHGMGASHRFILEAIPAGTTVLDVGCASGYLAAALRERGCRVYGVEPDADLARAASEHCERVFEIDVESARARDTLPGAVDVLVLGDVLEHLRDPWAVLAGLSAHVREGGTVVVSVPNAVHWNARRHIVRGRFPRHDHGTFDRTHLRWFTLDSARGLVTGAGLRVERERYTPSALPFDAPLRRALGAGGADRAPSLPARALQRLAVRAAPRLFALQFVFVCRR